MTGNIQIKHKHECDETTTDLFFEVEVEYDVNIGSPAVTYGPPESCDAGDPPEVNSLTYKLLSFQRKDIKGNVLEEWDGKPETEGKYLGLFEKLADKEGPLNDEIETKCCEAACEQTWDHYSD